MSSFSVSLLGTPRFERDGLTIEIRPRKNIALIAYLAPVALARDDPAAALACVEEILNHLETGSVNGTDEALRRWYLENVAAHRDLVREWGQSRLRKRWHDVSTGDLSARPATH